MIASLPDFVRERRPIELALVSGRGHYAAVIEPVLAASHTVWIATATLKELMVEDPRARPGRRRRHGQRGKSYRSILEVFAEQVRRGVEVRVLHAAAASQPFRAEFARHPELRRGAPAARGRFEMRQCPRVHLKAVVIDGARVYLGSANWTGAGLGAKGEERRNFELGIVSEDDLLLDEVQALFEAIWSGSRCPPCRLRDKCPAPLDGPRPRSPARNAP